MFFHLFHQLDNSQLAQIFDLMLKKEAKLAAQQKIQIELTSKAKGWLLAQNDQPEFGARPLRRIIARYLREPLADFLLTQNNREGQTKVIIDAKNNKLEFEIGDH